MSAPRTVQSAPANGRQTSRRRSSKKGAAASASASNSVPVESLFNRALLSRLEKVFSDVVITEERLQRVLLEETGKPVTDKAISNFFAKVDMDGSGRIEWSALASYLHLTLVEKEEAAVRNRLVDFHLPAKPLISPHQDSVVRCAVGTKGVIWSMGSDGVMASWPAHVSAKGGYAPLTVAELELAGKKGGTEPGHRWTTDFALLPDMNKLAVATGERKIYFFNMGGDFMTQFVVSNLPGIPTKMAGGYSAELDASILLFGDSNGALGLFVFPKYYWQSPFFKGRVDKSRPARQIPASDMLTETGAMDPEYKGVHLRIWHGHTEWVNEMIWEPTLGMFLSCSSDPKASMIIGEPIGLIRVEPATIQSRRGNQTLHRTVHRVKHLRVNNKQSVFTVCKGGIRSVSFSEELGLVATGGTDREIRLWSPTMNNHPSSTLIGHEFGIVSVAFKHGGKDLASIDSHRTVRIWNIAALACVRVISEQAHRISTDLSSMIFSESIRGLLMFPKHGLAYLELRKGKSPRPGCSHASPVRCIAFNERFQHVVTACDDGIISMWALESGDKVFEFRGWKATKSPLQSMVVTEGGTRLVTASESGETNLWQYSTGQHMCQFVESASMPSVTKVLYMVAGQIHNVITVGWSRRVNVYDSIPKGPHIEVLKPNNDWRRRSAHSDDVTCAAQFGRNSVVTGQYDGGVVVWNLSTGRPRKMPSRERMEQDQPPGPMQEYIVFGVAPIDSRLDSKDPNPAQLVVTAATGVYVWNTKAIHRGKVGACMAHFQVTDATGKAVEARSIAIWDDPTHCGASRLVLGDATGRITVYDIAKYCLKMSKEGSDNQGPPPIVCSWQAHCQTAVSSLVLRPPTEGLKNKLFALTAVMTGWTGKFALAAQAALSPGDKAMIVAAKAPKPVPPSGELPIAQGHETGVEGAPAPPEADSEAIEAVPPAAQAWAAPAEAAGAPPPATGDESMASTPPEGVDEEASGGVQFKNVTLPGKFDPASKSSGAPDTPKAPRENELANEDAFLVLSSSEDCRCRLWTHTGSYVGTFGQTGLWSLNDPEHWQAPAIPDEIREYDEALRQEEEKDEMFEKTRVATKQRSAPAWGLDEETDSEEDEDEDGASLDPVDLAAVREAVRKGDWGKVARMQYIGDGGDSSLYARRVLERPAFGAPPARKTMSAPPLRSSRVPVEKDYLEAGLPRKIGNYERRYRSQERERQIMTAREDERNRLRVGSAGGQPGSAVVLPTSSRHAPASLLRNRADQAVRSRTQSYREWSLQTLDPVAAPPPPTFNGPPPYLADKPPVERVPLAGRHAHAAARKQAGGHLPPARTGTIRVSKSGTLLHRSGDEAMLTASRIDRPYKYGGKQTNFAWTEN